LPQETGTSLYSVVQSIGAYFDVLKRVGVTHVYVRRTVGLTFA